MPARPGGVLVGGDAPGRLDACLLTDEERKLGLEGRALLPDPFPTWTLQEAS